MCSLGIMSECLREDWRERRSDISLYGRPDRYLDSSDFGQARKEEDEECVWSIWRSRGLVSEATLEKCRRTPRGLSEILTTTLEPWKIIALLLS